MTFEEMMARVLKTIEEREASYGDPDAMFAEITSRWGTCRFDVALKMTDLKIARMTLGVPDDDCFIDAIAYLLFAWRFYVLDKD